MEGQKENPLFTKADLFAKEVYRITQYFPKDELYGLTSQLRRAGLSVILNIVEGFARQSDQESNSSKEFRRFLIISFGSLKESRYLLYFAKEQKYFVNKEYNQILNLSNEVSKILWSIINPKK